jgi:predicted DNA-binding transcriptional regulator AlpA
MPEPNSVPPLGLDPASVAVLAPEALPGLLRALRTLEAVVLDRILTPAPAHAALVDGLPPVEGDRLLTVAQAAERLGMSRHAIYRRAGRWAFTRKIGRRTLRFSECGLEKAIATGRGL